MCPRGTGLEASSINESLNARRWNNHFEVSYYSSLRSARALKRFFRSAHTLLLIALRISNFYFEHNFRISKERGIRRFVIENIIGIYSESKPQSWCKVMWQSIKSIQGEILHEYFPKVHKVTTSSKKVRKFIDSTQFIHEVVPYIHLETR